MSYRAFFASRDRSRNGAARDADGTYGNGEAQASEICATCAVRDSSMVNAGACHGPAMMADNGVARIAFDHTEKSHEDHRFHAYCAVATRWCRGSSQRLRWEVLLGAEGAGSLLTPTSDCGGLCHRNLYDPEEAEGNHEDASKRSSVRPGARASHA
jgi:hypothetical protein